MFYFTFTVNDFLFYGSYYTLLKGFHTLGGGFVIPFQGYALSFWRYVQLELEKRDTPIGIAVMSYCRV